jgi:hypothetical protein
VTGSYSAWADPIARRAVVVTFGKEGRSLAKERSGDDDDDDTSPYPPGTVLPTDPRVPRRIIRDSNRWRSGRPLSPGTQHPATYPNPEQNPSYVNNSNHMSQYHLFNSASIHPSGHHLPTGSFAPNIHPQHLHPYFDTNYPGGPVESDAVLLYNDQLRHHMQQHQAHYFPQAQQHHEDIFARAEQDPPPDLRYYYSAPRGFLPQRINPESDSFESAWGGDDRLPRIQQEWNSQSSQQLQQHSYPMDFIVSAREGISRFQQHPNASTLGMQGDGAHDFEDLDNYQVPNYHKTAEHRQASVPVTSRHAAPFNVRPLWHSQNSHSAIERWPELEGEPFLAEYQSDAFVPLAIRTPFERSDDNSRRSLEELFYNKFPRGMNPLSGPFTPGEGIPGPPPLGGDVQWMDRSAMADCSRLYCGDVQSDSAAFDPSRLLQQRVESARVAVDQGIPQFQRRNEGKRPSTAADDEDAPKDKQKQSCESQDESESSVAAPFQFFQAWKGKPLSPSSCMNRPSSIPAEVTMISAATGDGASRGVEMGDENAEPAQPQHKHVGRGNTSLCIGDPLPIRYFDDGVEVDWNGQPLNRALTNVANMKQPATSASPCSDSLDAIEWSGKTSLWG